MNDSSDQHKKIAVIAGAGPAGLTAAIELLRRSNVTPVVYEADAHVGGISKTIVYKGNRMDLGGHRFFFLNLIGSCAGGRTSCRWRGTARR